jgi:hypothetical protein
VREERGRIDDAPMHEAQSTQVIVECVPDQDRIRTDEPI